MASLTSFAIRNYKRNKNYQHGLQLHNSSRSPCMVLVCPHPGIHLGCTVSPAGVALQCLVMPPMSLNYDKTARIACRRVRRHQMFLPPPPPPGGGPPARYCNNSQIHPSPQQHLRSESAHVGAEHFGRPIQIELKWPRSVLCKPQSLKYGCMVFGLAIQLQP